MEKWDSTVNGVGLSGATILFRGTVALYVAWDAIRLWRFFARGVGYLSRGNVSFWWY